MPNETKQQVILPKNSHLTNLLLRSIHHSTAHAGRNHMLAQLRQKFWIPGASGAIWRILHQCVTCKKLHGLTGQQLMADLPALLYKSRCRLLWPTSSKKRRGKEIWCYLYLSSNTGCASGRSILTRHWCMYKCNKKVHRQKRASKRNLIR